MLAHAAVLGGATEQMGPQKFEDTFGASVSLLLWEPLTPVPPRLWALPRLARGTLTLPRGHASSLPPSTPEAHCLGLSLSICPRDSVDPSPSSFTKAGAAPIGVFGGRTGLLSGKPEGEVGPYREAGGPTSVPGRAPDCFPLQHPTLTWCGQNLFPWFSLASGIRADTNNHVCKGRS